MDAQDFVQKVIDGLNQVLADDPDVRLADLAHDLGYSVKTLQMFRGGTCRSVRLAQQVAEIFPEAAGLVRCPHCQALPSLTFMPRRTL